MCWGTLTVQLRADSLAPTLVQAWSYTVMRHFSGGPGITCGWAHVVSFPFQHNRSF
jgi:hypothetical protein